MTARLKGRYREVERLLADVVHWAQGQEPVDAVALVGSYARGQARMASDADIVILTRSFEQYATDSSWLVQLRPGSRLIRSATWGPLLERRFRLPSGLLLDLGLVSPAWADLPLDPGTRRVLSDGHRILYDPQSLLERAVEALSEGCEVVITQRSSGDALRTRCP